MEAIVLAGGLGTRLRSVIRDIPKPMAPINGKPFLEYILKYLKVNGVKKVVLSVGYKWEEIEERFKNEYSGIKICYSVEKEPLGTGGGIKKSIEYIDSDKFFLLNGDTLFNVPLNEIFRYDDRGTKLIMSLKRLKNIDRYGRVTRENQFITGFHEKGCYVEGEINGGVYLVSKKIFEGYETKLKFSFEQFIQENYINLSIKGVVFDEYFIDIGVPEDYKKAKTELPNIIL
jgi:D-glycero-alpha-D-manno-heptose 1-phosphate guanylyltransferase